MAAALSFSVPNLPPLPTILQLLTDPQALPSPEWTQKPQHWHKLEAHEKCHLWLCSELLSQSLQEEPGICASQQLSSPFLEYWKHGKLSVAPHSKTPEHSVLQQLMALSSQNIDSLHDHVWCVEEVQASFFSSASFDIWHNTLHLAQPCEVL